MSQVLTLKCFVHRYLIRGDGAVTKGNGVSAMKGVKGEVALNASKSCSPSQLRLSRTKYSWCKTTKYVWFVLLEKVKRLVNKVLDYCFPQFTVDAGMEMWPICLCLPGAGQATENVTRFAYSRSYDSQVCSKLDSSI